MGRPPVRLSRFFVAIFTVRKDVAKLRVCELVQTTSGTDGEVTADICAGTELEFLDGTRRRFEPSIGVFGGDTDSDDVTLGTRFSFELVGFGFEHIEFDLRISIRATS